MSIKLIALDIDGTIVDEDSIVSPANKEAIRKAVESGVNIALVTGRHYDGVTEVMKTLELPEETPLILNNGAIIYSGGEILYKDFLTPEEVDGVIKYSSQFPGVVTSVFQPDIISLYTHPPIDRSWLLDRFEAFRIINRREVGNYMDLPREDGAKVLLIAETEEKAEHILNSWPEHLSSLKRNRSYPYLCEINSGSCDKGMGLKILCEKMGISLKDVLAVGDGETDVPMLAMAGYSVFIKHSDYLPDLPSHGVVAPEGYENCGVAWAIDKYLDF